MRKLKIVLVGGGSFRWTPRLVCNILENASLNVYPIFCRRPLRLGDPR